MKTDIRQIKNIRYSMDRNMTTVTLRNGRKFGWKGSKAKQYFAHWQKIYKT